MPGWVSIASLLGASGVVLGAFGAHTLKARLTPESLASWNTAVEYHLLHAVVLLVLAWTASNGDPSAPWAMKLFSAGIVFFSGSIYVLVLGGPRWLGPITPIGGICLVAAWLSLLAYARSSGG
ncbi:MAG: DUF423 domain-containing protein [bacterium]|nr:DUF423 domain-containing protein [bacterium]